MSKSIGIDLYIKTYNVPNGQQLADLINIYKEQYWTGYMDCHDNIFKTFRKLVKNIVRYYILKDKSLPVFLGY